MPQSTTWKFLIRGQSTERHHNDETIRSHWKWKKVPKLKPNLHQIKTIKGLSHDQFIILASSIYSMLLMIRWYSCVFIPAYSVVPITNKWPGIYVFSQEGQICSSINVHWHNCHLSKSFSSIRCVNDIAFNHLFFSVKFFSSSILRNSNLRFNSFSFIVVDKIWYVLRSQLILIWPTNIMCCFFVIVSFKFQLILSKSVETAD